MTNNRFSRTALLLGRAAMDTLAAVRVAVFGVGGVGGYAVEVLARSGVGTLDLFDNDRVTETNLNRQILATTTTLGRYKVDVAAERVRDINPDCRVTPRRMFYLAANADEVDLTQYDYVVDCIDTVAAKMELIRRCHRLGVPIIVCMGAAKKLDPTAFRVADVTKSYFDPLAKILRKQLRREGISHFKCVFSPEPPLEAIDNDEGSAEIPSNAFVPAAAGIIVGGEVVKDLLRRAGTLRGDAVSTAPCDTQTVPGPAPAAAHTARQT